MKRYWISFLVIFLAQSIFSQSLDAPKRLTNVGSLEYLMDSLELGASVHLCQLVKRERALTTDSAIERGIVSLKVVKTLRGATRTNLVLPYSFYRVEATYKSGDLIWPDFDGLGSSNLLCFVVKSAEDPSAYQIPARNFNEVASKVMAVRNDAEYGVIAASRMIEIYEINDPDKMAVELLKEVKKADPLVIDFALQMTAVKLSKTRPDEAIKIIETRVTKYRDNAQDAAEARSFVFFVERKSRTEHSPSFFCRCLALLASSASPAIKRDAIRGVAVIVRVSGDKPHFAAKNILSDQERRSLGQAMSELKSGDNPEAAFSPANLDLAVVEKWLGP